MKHIMRYNVTHNGVICPKGSEAPAEFVEHFKQRGFVELGEEPQVEAPKAESAPVAEEPKKKRGK